LDIKCADKQLTTRHRIRAFPCEEMSATEAADMPHFT